MYKNIALLTILTLSAATQCETEKQIVLGHALSAKSIAFLDNPAILKQVITKKSQQLCKVNINDNNNKLEKVATLRTLFVGIELLNSIKESNIVPSLEERRALAQTFVNLIKNNFAGEQYSRLIKDAKTQAYTYKQNMIIYLPLAQSFNIPEHIRSFFSLIANHEDATDEIKKLTKEYSDKTVALYETILNDFIATKDFPTL